MATLLFLGASVSQLPAIGHARLAGHRIVAVDGDPDAVAFPLAHGRFTPHLADLVPLHPRLATDLGIGLAVTLDAGTGGQGYLQRVASGVLSLVRARSGNKIVANSCLVVKSASGVACPATGPSSK